MIKERTCFGWQMMTVRRNMLNLLFIPAVLNNVPFLVVFVT